MTLIDYGPRWSLLRTTLLASVPLRMAELREVDADDRIAWMEAHWPTEQREKAASDDPVDVERIDAWNSRPDHRSPWITDGDVLMYGYGQTVVDTTAKLVTGLAILALTAPGGVDFGDLHFCDNHNECMEVAA